MESMGRLFGILCCLCALSSVSATELEDVARVLERQTAPAGVVFEMVGGDADSLNIALRRTEAYVTKMRKKFPEANYVIVSHGLEQFSLLKQNETDNPELHKRVESLVKDRNIPVHVCGTFAEMNQVDTDDFIRSVRVAESGPQQIQDFVEQGFILIEMELH